MVNFIMIICKNLSFSINLDTICLFRICTLIVDNQENSVVTNVDIIDIELHLSVSHQVDLSPARLLNWNKEALALIVVDLY